jgi:hypothetical protein
VTYEEGERLAKEKGLMFMETSAKNSYNVDEAFLQSAQMILKNVESSKESIDMKKKINLNKQDEPVEKDTDCKC